MGVEDQKEEREVLDAIFPEEITDISETEFRVSILLDVTQADDEDTEPPTIILRVQYPENYPDEAPQLEISAPQKAPKQKFFDIQEDKAHLLQSLEPTIEENMGMAMIYALVMALKDAAESLIADRQKAALEQRESEIAKAEEEENRKFQGTLVTREKFLAWRQSFRQEMEEAERKRQEEALAEDRKKRGPKEEVRLTGKQLWESGLAGKVEEEDDEEGIDGLEEIEKLEIEA